MLATSIGNFVLSYIFVELASGYSENGSATYQLMERKKVEREREARNPKVLFGLHFELLLPTCTNDLMTR